ncbi:MAG: CPBP family intramembrane metalloprotease [Verrucomicrobiota bacterium]|nr:CPBP family intramembrane metalloprotease [Verrucomicrobiota bacterium]
MKDAARLLAYAAATLILAALLAPVLFWSAQWLAGRGVFRFLAAYEFDRVFRRSVLIVALLLFWPLFRWLRIDGWRDFGLAPNRNRMRDVIAGFVIAAVPLFGFAAGLIACRVYSVRESISVGELASRTLSAAVVPLLEEPLFRGMILGVLLRRSSAPVAIFFTSAVFSILHFLKSPEQSAAVVTWFSGFQSIANSFGQFHEPVLVLAGFTTLFLLGWILADTRILTHSLWLPIGLHTGWIFASAIFNKVARREYDALPWLGRNLMIGIAPLGIALVSWAIARLWLRHVQAAKD